MIDLANLPVDITYQIIHFRDFLVASWPFLNKMMANHDWDDDVQFSIDWIQVNWEFLVERELLGKAGYIIPLENGRRITDPDSFANYKIVCETSDSMELIDRLTKKLNYLGEELLIDGFSSRYETTFGLYPPFDFVDLSCSNRKKLYVVPLDKCKFWLKSITP